MSNSNQQRLIKKLDAIEKFLERTFTNSVLLMKYLLLALLIVVALHALALQKEVNSLRENLRLLDNKQFRLDLSVAAAERVLQEHNKVLYELSCNGKERNIKLEDKCQDAKLKALGEAQQASKATGSKS